MVNDALSRIKYRIILHLCLLSPHEKRVRTGRVCGSGRQLRMGRAGSPNHCGADVGGVGRCACSPLSGWRRGGMVRGEDPSAHRGAGAQGGWRPFGFGIARSCKPPGRPMRPLALAGRRRPGAELRERHARPGAIRWKRERHPERGAGRAVRPESEGACGGPAPRALPSSAALSETDAAGSAFPTPSGRAGGAGRAELGLSLIHI